MNNITQNKEDMLIAGKRLKEIRIRKKLTQEKLCELINNLPENKKERSYHQISQLENGKRQISVEYAYLFSKVLDVNQNYFLLESDFETDKDRSDAICHNIIDKEQLCISLIQKMGYKIITTEEQEDGTISSMHRKYKKLTVFPDDSNEDILKKVENATPVRYYILQSPNGSKAMIEQEEFYMIINDILDYAKFRVDKHFHRFDNFGIK